MYVPFINLTTIHKKMQLDLDKVWDKVNQKGNYILSNQVKKFENNFANFLKVKSAIGVGNGLDALIIALKALDITAGDEVIVPAHTFIATWLAVTYVGAKVIPVDISLDTFGIDHTLIEANITKKTKAIIVVHLYGLCMPLESIKKIANKHKLHIIEDTAQAHGASYNGKMAGTLSDIGTFSFYPAKNLGALGDGGAVVTNSNKLVEKIRLLRNYGSVQRYQHNLKGFNSRLDELQAGLLNVKLKYLDRWNNRRRKIAMFYYRELQYLPYIVLAPYPKNPEQHVWHLFVVRTNKRDDLKKHMDSNNIETLIHYPNPPHLQKAYQDLGYKKNSFKNTEKISKEILSIPIGPHLSNAQIEYVVMVLKKFKNE